MLWLSGLGTALVAIDALLYPVVPANVSWMISFSVIFLFTLSLFSYERYKLSNKKIREAIESSFQELAKASKADIDSKVSEPEVPKSMTCNNCENEVKNLTRFPIATTKGVEVVFTGKCNRCNKDCVGVIGEHAACVEFMQRLSTGLKGDLKLSVKKNKKT